MYTNEVPNEIIVMILNLCDQITLRICEFVCKDLRDNIKMILSQN